MGEWGVGGWLSGWVGFGWVGAAPTCVRGLVRGGKRGAPAALAPTPPPPPSPPPPPRPALASAAFRLTLREWGDAGGGQQQQQEGGGRGQEGRGGREEETVRIAVLDALALASKHDFPELLEK